jgi:uncharacterized membrane protein (UPF0127 family)
MWLDTLSTRLADLPGTVSARLRRKRHCRRRNPDGGTRRDFNGSAQMIRSCKSTLVASACLLALGACSVDAAAPSVELKGQRFDIEIAQDDASRTRGLMFRDSMPADHGMLFLFSDMQPRAFWMKNTHIPLDILFFDADYKLVSVQERVPPCRSDPCAQYPSEGPAQYVLELNAGTASRLGVKPGDPLTVKR